MKITMARTVGNTLPDNTRRDHRHNLSPVPCAFCGEPADLRRTDVIVEAHGQHTSHTRINEIWHRSCFDDFLDQGEET